MSEPKHKPRRHALIHRERIERRKTYRPPKHKPGVCRFCGCTEKRACVLYLDPIDETPATCWWVDKSRTVCSNPKCVAEQNRQIARCK